MMSNASTVSAPYVVADVVSYQCKTNFAPKPADAAMTCTCTSNQVDDIAASWVCDPSGVQALETTCQPGDYRSFVLFLFCLKYIIQNYKILFKEMLLEIGCIEELRTTSGSTEVPQTFFTIPFTRENTV